MAHKALSLDAVIAKCRSLCKSRATPSVAKDADRYFKGVVKIHGLRAPAVDRIYKEVYKAAGVVDWDLPKVFETGLSLLACDYQEEKRLGVLFLKRCGSEMTHEQVDRIGDAIDVHVYDWATCDILAGGVLRWAIEGDASLVPHMIEWSTAENLWRRRACCVSFLSSARRGNHSDAIERICDHSVQMKERFVQLGVGWLLREFSCYDRQRTVEFLKSHSELISREGLRYALEKMPAAVRKELMDYHKEQNSKTIS